MAIMVCEWVRGQRENLARQGRLGLRQWSHAYELAGVALSLRGGRVG